MKESLNWPLELWYKVAVHSTEYSRDIQSEKWESTKQLEEEWQFVTFYKQVLSAYFASFFEF